MIKFKENPDSRQATKQDLLDIAEAIGVQPISHSIVLSEIRAMIRLRIEKLERLGKLDTEFDRFGSWPEVVAYCKAGLSLYYHAPLDHRPQLVDYQATHRSRDALHDRVLRIIPDPRDGDPFLADESHLSRMRRRTPEET